MSYLYLKALHIIFVVTWFAGLFYVVRLFIYHSEALEREEPERSVLSRQLAFMSKRLWIVITWPSAILNLAFGLSLIIIRPSWLQQPFMYVKLGFVFLLVLYHFACHGIYLQLQKGIARYSSMQLRVFNEIATVILFAVVFLIVLKNQLNWFWSTLGLLSFAIVLIIAIKLYKKSGEKE